MINVSIKRQIFCIATEIIVNRLDFYFSLHEVAVVFKMFEVSSDFSYCY